MNFINTMLLGLAVMPKGLYKKMGVNVAQLHAILETKLLMDNRRPFSFRSMGGRQQKKESNNTSIATAAFSLLMGLLFCMAFGQPGLELQLTLYFSMMICMLAAMLISDFTDVLIDVRDNYIILPKPVNDHTFVLARILHIMLHVLKMMIPMALPGIVAVAIMHGIGAMLVFVPMVLLSTMFTLFLINLIYVLILKILPPERFKTVISFIQIVLAIVVYGSVQIVPRYLEKNTFDLTAINNIYFAPPYWFAAAVKTITTFTATNTEIIAALLAVVFPVVALYVMIKFLAPSFNEKLGTINAVADSIPQPVTGTARGKTQGKSYSEQIAAILIKDKTEKGGFLFSWKVGSRSRDFYMKVYPAFGYLVVVFFMAIFMNKRIDVQKISSLAITGTVVKYAALSIIYFTGYILFVVIAQITFSDRYKAAWLFYTTPLHAPGKILSGTLKSIVMKFYFPVMCILTIVSIAVFGWHLLPNLFLGFSNVVLIISTMFYSGRADFPFSIAQNGNANGSNFIKNLFRMFLMGIAGLLQFLIFSFPVVVIICLVLSLIANWMLMDSIKKISWQKIKQAEI